MSSSVILFNKWVLAAAHFGMFFSAPFCQLVRRDDKEKNQDRNKN